jgi:sulfur-carrier protein adenylyltransferase/sulfurtransferase
MDENITLTELEKKRYKLQIMLPGIGAAGQEKLKNARVLIVGIGGLGSQTLQSLTAMGVGTLGFLDYDIIEEVNLSHQVFFGMKDIGKLKVLITRERLSGMNPLVRFNVLNVKLTLENAGSIIPGYDIIVDATNKRDAHYLINDMCLKYGKVMVYGCVCDLKGRISVFNYNEGPSFRCAWPDIAEACGPYGKEGQGMPGILPGVTGSYLANEVLKIITGNPGVLSGRVMIIDVLNYENRFVTVTRDPANF